MSLEAYSRWHLGIGYWSKLVEMIDFCLSISSRLSKICCSTKVWASRKITWNIKTKRENGRSASKVTYSKNFFHTHHSKPSPSRCKLEKIRNFPNSKRATYIIIHQRSWKPYAERNERAFCKALNTTTSNSTALQLPANLLLMSITNHI